MKISGLLIFTAALLCSASAGAQTAAPAGNSDNGKKHFLSDGCYQCHGVNGDGAALTGPKLSRTALPYEAFVQQLRKPVAEMPPYEAEIVPDATAADIFAFLKGQPASPDAKSLPLLQGMGVK